MSPTQIVTARVQRATRDRYMQRLELPGERRGSLVAGVLCLTGAVAGCVLAWVLS